jgi:hypothetical protein
LYATTTQSGGTGIVYGASIILNLSKAKLKESDGTQSGIIVTAKPDKNRFCKPTVVKFHISYTHGMNPYVGLEEYMSWDNCGVERGKFITDKEYAKLGEADKEKARQHPLDENVYMLPSPTGRNICTKHSTESFKLNEIFTKAVWTQDRLAEMAAYLKPIFEYAHHTEDEIEDIITEE